MNKFSLVFNSILAAAVVGLYVLYFTKEGNAPRSALAVKESSLEVVEDLQEKIEKPLISSMIDTSITDSVSIEDNSIEEETNVENGVEAAFVDFDRINTEWKYFQRETKKIEDSHMVDLQRLEQDKKELEQEYTTYVQSVQQGGLQDPTKEEYIQKEQLRISKREQQLMSAAQNDALKANTDGMTKMKAVISSYAKRKGYSYVIATGLRVGSPVLYNEAKIDVTDDILNLLNKKYQ